MTEIKYSPANTIRVNSEDVAEDLLKRAGFSIGRRQRDDPRGIIFGDVDIAKWRNLSPRDREELDGTFRRDFMGGPVTITLFKYTNEARRTLNKAAREIQLEGRPEPTNAAALPSPAQRPQTRPGHGDG